jgi:Protein of unknown function (DUF1439)
MLPTTRDQVHRFHGKKASVTGVVLACALSAGCSLSYTISLTASDIQQTLQRKLPISKSKLLVTATVRALDVEFMEAGNRMLLRPEVDLSIVGQRALRGRAVVAGQIRYMPETGEFFFDKPTVAEVAIEGLPGSLRVAAQEVIARCAEGYLAAAPVYQLKQSDFKQSLAKLVLKSVLIRNGRLEIMVGTP